MAGTSTLSRVKFGDFLVDFDSFELRKHGIRLKLQDQPFQILKLLLRQPGQLVTREKLRMELWTESTFVDFDAGLNAAVRRLRDALNDSADEPRYIETLPRHGYRFIAPVEIATESAPELRGRVPISTANGHGQQHAAMSPEAAIVLPSENIKPWTVPWRRVGVFACVLVVMAGVGTLALRSRVSAKRTDGDRFYTVAVLPLENLSGDPSQDYFVDGMTDALITNLTKVGSMRVISRTSTMHYKGTHRALREIARELNVGTVVEGSVFRSGNHFRVTAQVVDAATDHNLWGRDYDGNMQDILQLQNQLAREVAIEVAGRLTAQEQTRLKPAHPVKPEVYEAYLKGRYFSNRPMEDGLKKGVSYFQDAIRLDPDYAPAYSGLADAYSFLGFVSDETDRSRRLAMEAAQKAISLDDSLAEAHASLGWVLHRHMQDWTGAEKEYRRAIELNPSYAIAHRFYGIFLTGIGLDALACEEHRLAHELDPLNPLNTNRWAQCVYAAGHFDDAVHLVQDILEIDPNNLDSLWTLGEMYEKQRRFPEAIQQYEKGKEATGGKAFIPYSLLGSAYAGSGQTAKAEQVLREMNQKFGEDKWISATIHAQMGRKELAIRELMDDAADCGPGTCGPAASLYVWNWRFDSLRSDPRFQALLKKFNYPESAYKR